MARTRLGYPPGFVAAIDEVLGLAASGGVSVHLTLRLMKVGPPGLPGPLASRCAVHAHWAKGGRRTALTGWEDQVEVVV